MPHILHLSDLHVKQELPIHSESFFKRIAAFFSSTLNDNECLIIVISGDVAYSGLASQYQTFDETFQKFLSNLKSQRSDISIKIYLVPGNHDANHSPSSNRVQIIEKINKHGFSDESTINNDLKILVEPFNEFYDYNQYLTNNVYPSTESRIVKNDELADQKINIVQINTSLLSQRNESPGKLVLPVKHLEAALKEIKSDFFNIAIMHHPTNWLNPNLESHRREVISLLEKYTDLILVGHEHEKSASEVRNIVTKSKSIWVTGGEFTLQGESEKSFNIIEYNRDSILVNQCNFKNERIEQNKTTDVKISEVKKMKVPFRLNESFEEFLNDTEIGLTHQNKENLILADIFVWPKLVSPLKQKPTEAIEPESSDKMLENIDYLIINGDDQSGKTALCKMAHKKYREMNLFPLFYSGKKINVNRTFDKTISDVISENYSYSDGSVVDYYYTIDKINKVFIIDDFDLIKNASEDFLNDFIKQLKVRFSKILITVNESYNITGFLKASREQEDFGWFKINKFGHALREKLISKWVGFYNKSSVNALPATIETHDKVVDIIGKNIVPSYPVHVLTILQTLDLNKNHDLKHTSYGNCYTALVYFHLKKQIHTEDKISTYLSILTSFANYLFERGKTHVSFEDFDSFFGKYKTEYYCNYSSKDVIDNLSSSMILVSRNDDVGFRYGYIKNYFLGKYLAENYASSKDKFHNLMKNLHTQDNANIVVFLLHHTNESALIDELTLYSMELFQTEVPATLSKVELFFLKDLEKRLVEHVIDARTPEQHRENELAKKDRMDTIKEDDDGEDVSTNIISDINRSFRMLEIFGQIIKNKHGSLRQNQLKQLCKESYESTFRLITVLFNLIQQKETEEILINAVRKIAKKKEIDELKDEEQIKTLINKSIAAICYHICYGLIDKLSFSVGIAPLKKMYFEIENEYESPAVNLVSLSIKLKTNRVFPFEDVETLKKSMDDNIFVSNLLRKFVIDYIYMNKVDFKDKQKISEMLGIPVSKQIYISGRGKK